MHWLLNGLSVAIRVYVKFVTNLGGYWSPVLPMRSQDEISIQGKKSRGDQTSSRIQIGARGDFEPLVFICLTPLLLLMFVMKLKPSQNNKILQIF
jgi:hypothetical protein